MKNSFKILYIHPVEFWGSSDTLPSFPRISNYLNSRKKQLNGPIEEEYLDLRYETLSEFSPKNIKNYRNGLKELLKTIFKQFKFNLAAISCYGSSNYLNTLEVAFTIRNLINTSCYIVVGGVHSTICPEDFQINGIPEYFYDVYPKNTNPFDYLIKEEGEIPFFKLIKKILNKTNQKRKDLTKPCIMLNSEIIQDLNDLPLIEFSLFKKYKDIISDNKFLWIDFSRGCMYSCKFCINSLNYVNCYRNVRIKSVKKCIDELRIIKNTKWLTIKRLFISDMIFFPKKSAKREFFNEFERFIEEEGPLPFPITVSERIDLCSKEDLENYKKYNITPNFGLESCSRTLLLRMRKIMGNTEEQIYKGIDRYLEQTEEIIRIGNKIELPIQFNLLLGLPGSDAHTIKENHDFFLKKRFEGKSLAEKFHIILKLNKYMANVGSEMYSNAEEEFGTKIYYKEWWKIFDRDQPFYAAYVDPSSNFTLKQSTKCSSAFTKEFIRKQRDLGNPAYSFGKIIEFTSEGFERFRLFKKLRDKFE